MPTGVRMWGAIIVVGLYIRMHWSRAQLSLRSSVREVCGVRGPMVGAYEHQSVYECAV